MERSRNLTLTALAVALGMPVSTVRATALATAPGVPPPPASILVCPPSIADPCNPAPPEDNGEVSTPGLPNALTRWTFDDNKFCNTGPGTNCGGFNPGIDFCDSPNPFEMYILADCGTEMHVPLFDMESGCVSLLHDEGPNPPTPITIRARNGLPPWHSQFFDQTGTTICWSAQDCTGSNPTLCNQNDPNGSEIPTNCPGGPGDQVTMDISFFGNPSTCGVYIARFTNWAGCTWDLFSNCDGTNSDHFTIFHSICDARAAYAPLPQLVIENLTTSDGGGCSVDYCVDVRNIGCVALNAFLVEVTNGNDTDNRIVAPGLPAGGTAQICGSLQVPLVGGPATTTVVASADPLNGLAECSENPQARSCAPTQGSHSAARDQLVIPPAADIAPPAAICPGGSVTLDASGSTAPPTCTVPLEYQWSDGTGVIQPWSTSPTLDVTPATTTTYTVEVRCPTSPGCVVSATAAVVVVVPPEAVLPAPAGVCTGTAVRLDASGSRAPGCSVPLEFQWSDGTGVIQPWGTSPVLNVAPVANTTYTLEVRCPDHPSCVASLTATVDVVPYPLPLATAPDAICTGAGVTIDTSGSNRNGCPFPLEYQVSDGATIFIPWTNSTTLGPLSPTGPTTYVVQVRCPAGPGCEVVIDHPITIVPIPTAAAGLDLRVCLNAPATLDGSGSSAPGCPGGALYEWREGAVVMRPASPVPTWDPPTDALGTRTYTLVVSCSSLTACQASDPVDVVVRSCLLAVRFATFGARAVPGTASAIEVSWRTTSEADTIGFVVERATRPGGPFRAVGTPVSAGGTGGADYRLVDTSGSSPAGSLPWYRIVELTSNGRGDETPAFQPSSPGGDGAGTRGGARPRTGRRGTPPRR